MQREAGDFSDAYGFQLGLLATEPLALHPKLLHALAQYELVLTVSCEEEPQGPIDCCSPELHRALAAYHQRARSLDERELELVAAWTGLQAERYLPGSTRARNLAACLEGRILFKEWDPEHVFRLCQEIDLQELGGGKQQHAAVRAISAACGYRTHDALGDAVRNALFACIRGNRERGRGTEGAERLLIGLAGQLSRSW